MRNINVCVREKNNKFDNNIRSQAPCIVWQKKRRKIQEKKRV